MDSGSASHGAATSGVLASGELGPVGRCGADALGGEGRVLREDLLLGHAGCERVEHDLTMIRVPFTTAWPWQIFGSRRMRSH